VSVAYGFAFLILATIAGLSAAALGNSLGWPALGLGYFAVSLALLSATYFGAGPRVFLKRESGHIRALAWIPFAPYFLLNVLIFRLYRAFSREPAFVQLISNLYFGRRLTPSEAREGLSICWVAVLDLAAEFSEVATLRAVPGYRSLPVLDATTPTEQQLRETVVWLTENIAKGPVYVHCAMGHGRTACVVVAYLLASGTAQTVAEGVRMMRVLRPGVRLNRVQREALRRYKPIESRSDGTIC
jgi:hypothetical protein